MRRLLTSSLSSFIAILAFSTLASAAPIAVHNTGVNASDTLVNNGEAAAWWTLLSAPVGATETPGSGTFRYFHPAYAPDSTDSAWVSGVAGGNVSAGGVYVYQLMIDLTGLNPNTAVITGQFGTDNDGFIRLNGGAPAATQSFAGFGTLTNFTLNSGFVAGVNSIQVGVNNGGNPTAFRVDFSVGTADPIGQQVPVPEPSSILFLGLGAIGLMTTKLRRRAARRI